MQLVLQTTSATSTTSASVCGLLQTSKSRLNVSEAKQMPCRSQLRCRSQCQSSCACHVEANAKVHVEANAKVHALVMLSCHVEANAKVHALVDLGEEGHCRSTNTSIVVPVVLVLEY